MRVMTKIEEEVLQDLVRLSQGDLALVEEALAKVDTEDKPDLADVVEHIKAEVLRRLKVQAA